MKQGKIISFVNNGLNSSWSPQGDRFTVGWSYHQPSTGTRITQTGSKPALSPTYRDHQVEEEQHIFHKTRSTSHLEWVVHTVGICSHTITLCHSRLLVYVSGTLAWPTRFDVVNATKENVQEIAMAARPPRAPLGFHESWLGWPSGPLRSESDYKLMMLSIYS